MTPIIFYVFIAILIGWGMTQPWRKGWLQFLFFCLGSILIPTFVITSGDDPYFKKTLSLLAVCILVFGIFIKLRYSEKNLFRLFSSGALIETDVEEKKKYEKLSKIMFITFYIFCGIYLLLYGF
jgi:hypothetical protein